MTLPHKEAESNRDEKVLWLSRNRGALAKIAQDIGVSHVFVQDVYHGRRNSKKGRIERRLASAGAPGFERRANA